MYKPDPGAEFLPSPRWVRTYLAGVPVADSKRLMLLREAGRLPVYYFPLDDVRQDLLEASDHRRESGTRGQAHFWNIQVGDRRVENAAWHYPDPPADGPDLREYVAFSWNLMDAWFEEDDQVYVHPRDPFKRVDVLHSSRHVRVVIAGETVAESRHPRLLFETGLPTRYYLPPTDVRMDLLVPSNRSTQCPYKGVASYYSVRAGEELVKDIAWYYPFPIPECPKIENLICFFNEKVDTYVDGELEERPQTPWS
jgi:uncharacterized protein (DUF427 family)